MKKLHEVINSIEEFAPPALAQFDHVGLLQGELMQPIRKVGLTLDYSLQAIREAARLKCDLLVTHHGPTDVCYPLRGNLLHKICEADAKKLAVYRCHLSLDLCEGGIIDSVCKLLQIPAIKTRLTYGRHNIFGGVNLAKDFQLTYDELIERTMVFNGNYLRIAGEKREVFSRIAITSGAGFKMEFFDQLKPEVYIGGEFEQEAVKYAEDLGIMLVELGHHASETRALDIIASKIKKMVGVPVVQIEIPDTIEVVKERN